MWVEHSARTILPFQSALWQNEWDSTPCLPINLCFLLYKQSLPAFSPYNYSSITVNQSLFFLHNSVSVLFHVGAEQKQTLPTFMKPNCWQHPRDNQILFNRHSRLRSSVWKTHISVNPDQFMSRTKRPVFRFFLFGTLSLPIKGARDHFARRLIGSVPDYKSALRGFTESIIASPALIEINMFMRFQA